MITDEAAFEQALALNVIKMTEHRIIGIGKRFIELADSLLPEPLEFTPENEKLIEQVGTISKNLIQARDCIKILLHHYNNTLVEWGDNNPGGKEAILAQINDHDVMHAVELQMRLSAEDRLLQLKMKGD